jgi:hypothetical protein
MIEVGDIVKFNRVSSSYEYQLMSEVKRKNKTDYIGEEGTVTSVTYADDEPTNAVVDVMFKDGQKWCFEKQQLQVVIPIQDVRDKLSRKVMCVETEEIFDSARKAGRSIKVTPAAIRQSCRTGGKLKGKHWKYVEDNVL